MSDFDVASVMPVKVPFAFGLGRAPAAPCRCGRNVTPFEPGGTSLTAWVIRS